MTMDVIEDFERHARAAIEHMKATQDDETAVMPLMKAVWEAGVAGLSWGAVSKVLSRLNGKGELVPA